MSINKPIIYAGWSKFEEEIQHHLLPFKGINGINYVSDKEDLLEAMERLKSSGEVIKYDIDTVNSYIYSPDGNTSQRIINAIIDICK